MIAFPCRKNGDKVKLPLLLIQYRGSLAQLVEQRPEEPCVPSSSLGGATKLISEVM